MAESPLRPSQPGGVPTFEKPAPAAPTRKSSPPSVFIFLALIVLGFGLAAGGFAFLSRRSSRGAKLPLPQSANVTSYQVEVLAPESPDAEEAEEVVEVGSDAPLPTLTLGGILFSGEGTSMALINGKVVREGATIEGAKLIKVSAERVELDFEGRRISIRAL